MLSVITPVNRTLTRRCLTLLEVLIALVLLASVTAIVAPTVIDRLDERAFEAAADGTNEQLMMARAHAQAIGEPVEVTYSPASGHVQARVYAPWETESDLNAIEPGTSPLASIPLDHEESSSAGVTSSSASGFPVALDRDESATRGKFIAEGWATRSLSKGMRIANHPPFAASSDGPLTEEEICLPDGTLVTVAVEEDYETLEDLEHGQDVRLAVFMPDGSAMVGKDLWLDDGRGRCGRISINAWSGLPIFQRIADLQSRSDAAKDSWMNEDAFAPQAADDRPIERDD